MPSAVHPPDSRIPSVKLQAWQPAGGEPSCPKAAAWAAEKFAGHPEPSARCCSGAGRSAAGGRDNGGRGGRAESRPLAAVPTATWAAAKPGSIIDFSPPALAPYKRGREGAGRRGHRGVRSRAAHRAGGRAPPGLAHPPPRLPAQGFAFLLNSRPPTPPTPTKSPARPATGTPGMRSPAGLRPAPRRVHTGPGSAAPAAPRSEPRPQRCQPGRTVFIYFFNNFFFKFIFLEQRCALAGGAGGVHFLRGTKPGGQGARSCAPSIASQPVP